MPLTLDSPDVINGTVTDEEISSFTIDINNQLIYVTYDRKDAQGNIIVPDVTHTIAGAEMLAAITRASTTAGGDVYAAIKEALYFYLPGNGIIS